MGDGAEEGRVGQFDLPAVSWQPEDNVRRATNQTLCESTLLTGANSPM